MEAGSLCCRLRRILYASRAIRQEHVVAIAVSAGVFTRGPTPASNDDDEHCQTAGRVCSQHHARTGLDTVQTPSPSARHHRLHHLSPRSTSLFAPQGAISRAALSGLSHARSGKSGHAEAFDGAPPNVCARDTSKLVENIASLRTAKGRPHSHLHLHPRASGRGWSRPRGPRGRRRGSTVSQCPLQRRSRALVTWPPRQYFAATRSHIPFQARAADSRGRKPYDVDE